MTTVAKRHEVKRSIHPEALHLASYGLTLLKIGAFKINFKMVMGCPNTDCIKYTMASNPPPSQKAVIIMEQVAMYMAALPCPPMPLLVKQEIEDEDEDYPSECYKNSHDLIASLLLIAMHHGDTQLNEHRKAKQTELTKKLLSTLQNLPTENEQDAVQIAYTAFSEFTSGYICAFANIDVSVSFMPMDYVVQNDCVHKACCSWHKAQEVILFKAKQMKTKGDSKNDDNNNIESETPDQIQNDEKEKELPDVIQIQINNMLNVDWSESSYKDLLALHCKRFSN